MPKTYSTPCTSRLLTSRSAPVCAAVSKAFAGVLIYSLPLLARDPRLDRDAGLLLKSSRSRVKRCGSCPRAESPNANLRQCTAAGALPTCDRRIRSADGSPARSANGHSLGSRNRRVFRECRGNQTRVERPPPGPGARLLSSGTQLACARAQTSLLPSLRRFRYPIGAACRNKKSAAAYRDNGLTSRPRPPRTV